MVFCLWLPGVCCFLSAQERATVPETVAKARIVDSQVVDLGERSITYNLVEPPVLKPEPAPSPAPPLRQPATLTAAELEEIRVWEAKSDLFLFLSCTVFDRKVTEISWWREEGEYIIWSGIDFNHLQGIVEFETATTRYSLFLAVGEDSLDSLREWDAEVSKSGLSSTLKRPLPVLPVTISLSSQYQIVKFPKTGIEPEVKAALDDLHQYYDASGEQLARQFNESEKARIAQEEWLKANPPQPKDTTINFFPIRSSHIDTRPSGGAE